MVKECQLCFETKPIEQFSVNRAMYDKRQKMCKPCAALYRKYLKEKKQKDFASIRIIRHEPTEADVFIVRFD
jgi:hypothetical protein